MAHNDLHQNVSDRDQPWASDPSVPAPPGKEGQARKLQKESKPQKPPKTPFDLINPLVNLDEEPPQQSPLPGAPEQSPIEKEYDPSYDEVFRSIPAQTAALFSQMLGGAREITGRGLEAVTGEAEEGSTVKAVQDWLITGGREQALRAHDAIERARPKGMTFWQEAVSSAGTSLGQQLPYYLLAILTKGRAQVAVAGFGIQEFNRAYADAKIENPHISEATAISHAFVSGILESGTEMYPAKILFAPGSGGFKRLVNFMMMELPGENVAEVGQLLSEYIHGLKEDVTGKEILETIKLTSAATILAGGAQVYASNVANKIIERRRKEKEEPDKGGTLGMRPEPTGGAHLKYVSATGEYHEVPPGKESPPEMRGEKPLYKRGRRIPEEVDMRRIVEQEQEIKKLTEEEQRLEGDIARQEIGVMETAEQPKEPKDAHEVVVVTPEGEEVHRQDFETKQEAQQFSELYDQFNQGHKDKVLIQATMTPKELEMIEEDKRYWAEREHREPLEDTIPDRPYFTAADMEGMAPPREEMTLLERDKAGVEYYEIPGGGIFAMHNGREIGYALPLAEDKKQGFDVTVAKEWTRKGIGGQLMRQFLKKNPGHPTGGLTRAGKGMAKKAGLLKQDVLGGEISEHIDVLNHADLTSMERKRSQNWLRKRIRPAIQFYDEDGGEMHVEIGEEGETHPDIDRRGTPDLPYSGSARGFYDTKDKHFYHETELSSLDSVDLLTVDERVGYLKRMGFEEADARKVADVYDEVTLKKITTRPAPFEGIDETTPENISEQIRAAVYGHKWRPKGKRKQFWESKEYNKHKNDAIKQANHYVRNGYRNGDKAAIERFGWEYVNQLHQAMAEFGHTVVFFQFMAGKGHRRHASITKGGMILRNAPHGAGGGGGIPVIYLNADVGFEHPHVIIGHELVHQIRANAPWLYNELADLATPDFHFVMRKSHQMRVVQEYGKTKVGIDALKEEIISDFLGNNLMTEEFMQRVAQHKNKALATRMIKYIKGVLGNIRAVFSRYDAVNREMNKQFKNSEEMLDKAAEIVAKYSDLRKAEAAAVHSKQFSATMPSVWDPSVPQMERTREQDFEQFKDQIMSKFEGAIESLKRIYEEETRQKDTSIEQSIKVKGVEHLTTGEADIETAARSGDEMGTNRQVIKVGNKLKRLDPVDPEAGKEAEKYIAALNKKPRSQWPKLIGVDANAKTIKGQPFGYMTGVMYMAPEKSSGVMNLCPLASEGCTFSCLFRAGKAAFDAGVVPSRIHRTWRFWSDREGYLRDLQREIKSTVKAAHKEGLIPVVRLNGTSDLPWENYKIDGKSLMEHFPTVQFYDYTKIGKRARKFAKGKLPSNYHITFSRSEDNDAEAIEIMKRGGNAAVVFRDGLPETWNGFKVINGDENDLRFRDEPGTVVGLVAKGKEGKADDSGFVLDIPLETIVYRPPNQWESGQKKKRPDADWYYNKELNRHVVRGEEGKYKPLPRKSTRIAKSEARKREEQEWKARLKEKRERDEKRAAKKAGAMEQGLSHLTAIGRKKLSSPMMWLKSNKLLKGRVLDFGSGRGFDAEHLGIEEYDPYYQPNMPKGKFDTITSHFVLNVLNEEEGDKVIEEVRAKLKKGGVAYFTVRRDIKQEGTTSKGTYQRTVYLGADFDLVREVKGGYAIYRMTKEGNLGPGFGSAEVDPHDVQKDYEETEVGVMETRSRDWLERSDEAWVKRSKALKDIEEAKKTGNKALERSAQQRLERADRVIRQLDESNE